jgi:hypothetical protein
VKEDVPGWLARLKAADANPPKGLEIAMTEAPRDLDASDRSTIDGWIVRRRQTPGELAQHLVIVPSFAR